MNDRRNEYNRRVARLNRVEAAGSPADQLMADIFTTALEGGIDYWSSARSYHWSNADGSEDYTGFYANIVDEESTQRYRIDRQVINKGYRLATGEFRNKVSWSTSPPPMVVTEDSAWDFDASDADVIVQLGLFGNVVYG